MPRCRECKREVLWVAMTASSRWVDYAGQTECDRIGHPTHRVWLPQMANSIVVGVWLDADDV